MTDVNQQISDIKVIMERSTRFISLSGLSGVMAGVYALLGAFLAYYWVYYPNSPIGYRSVYANDTVLMVKLLITAIGVLLFSLVTGVLLAMRKTTKTQTSLWNPTARRFVISLVIPLLVGGLFIMALMLRGYFVIVAPASLIFYGLALLNASNHTYSDIKFLGYCQIATGLFAAFLPGYGLLFWSFGFGVLHIAYGISMYYKYDK